MYKWRITTKSIRFFIALPLVSFLISAPVDASNEILPDGYWSGETITQMQGYTSRIQLQVEAAGGFLQAQLVRTFSAHMANMSATCEYLGESSDNLLHLVTHSSRGECVTSFQIELTSPQENTNFGVLSINAPGAFEAINIYALLLNPNAFPAPPPVIENYDILGIRIGSNWRDTLSLINSLGYRQAFNEREQKYSRTIVFGRGNQTTHRLGTLETINYEDLLTVELFSVAGEEIVGGLERSVEFQDSTVSSNVLEQSLLEKYGPVPEYRAQFFGFEPFEASDLPIDTCRQNPIFFDQNYSFSGRVQSSALGISIASTLNDASCYLEVRYTVYSNTENGSVRSFVVRLFSPHIFYQSLFPIWQNQTSDRLRNLVQNVLSEEVPDL